MADLTARRESLLDYLPGNVQQGINTSPVLNALSKMLQRPTPNLEAAAMKTYGTPEQRDAADRDWLIQQARGPGWLERQSPVVQDGANKLMMLANFVGPGGVKLPGIPRAPGRYAMEYPGGRIDYKDMDGGGVHVSGIYTNPETRGQGNARRALDELIAAADTAKMPMSLEISPGAPGVDPARLRQWYESRGFSGPDYAMTRQPPPTGIRAYHGSPYDFDRFDISKIGTGEGAQAYGRGLYFAESEAVAKSYRDTLAPVASLRGKPLTEDDLLNLPVSSRMGFDTVFDRIKSLGSTQAVRDEIAAAPGTAIKGIAKSRYMQILDEIDASGIVPVKNPGRMYEVNIKADPEQFLDWDKPLSQQPEGVRRAYTDALKAVGHPDPTQVERSVFGSSGQGMENLIGAWVKHDRAKASDVLRDAGIPGIKYLDQGSRNKAFRVDLETSRGPYRVDDPATFSTEAQAIDYLRAKEAEGFKAKLVDQGSRNFVVFDDALITILRKYGLLPPIAAGTAAALDQQEPPL